MAWNEPGGGRRDPWGSGGRDQGPPDLDEVIRKLSDQFGGLFGGKGNRGGGSSAGAPKSGHVGVWIVLALLVGGWAVSGFYIVDEGKRGVVLRFGRYAYTTDPGPHLRFPWPIERHEVVDVEQRRAEELGYRAGPLQPRASSVPNEALMLTQDENIVDVRISVQYQVDNPRDFLFNVVDPRITLRQVVESAVRETIGKRSMDFVLTQGRSQVVADIQTLSQSILDNYKIGLRLTNVNLQDAQPPEEVQDAFADAIKAREDEQRLKNEAEAYSNEIIPIARGQAARQLEEAEAYREQVIARAKGEADRFDQLVNEYRKAPQVMRQRLYLETFETILANTSKVFVDVEGGNHLFYLPLDRLISSMTPSPPASPDSATSGSRVPETPQLRDTSRSRDSR